MLRTLPINLYWLVIKIVMAYQRSEFYGANTNLYKLFLWLDFFLPNPKYKIMGAMLWFQGVRWPVNSLKNMKCATLIHWWKNILVVIELEKGSTVKILVRVDSISGFMPIINRQNVELKLFVDFIINKMRFLRQQLGEPRWRMRML